MCKECVTNVKWLFPGLRWPDASNLLFECTCFPFGNADQVFAQLKPMSKRYKRRKKTSGWQQRWLSSEMGRAAYELDKAMEKARK